MSAKNPTNEPSATESMSRKEKQAAERAERLAANLRQNLRRRKSQSRERRDGDKS